MTCAELIVIGSTGQGALPRMLLGSTAGELIRATRRPMVVVRGKHEAEQRPSSVDVMPDAPVLVGVDGSQASNPAIEFAFEFAARHDCAVHAVHAWYDAPLDVVASAGMSDTTGTEHRRSPLLERADNARLLVVGSHGHGVLHRTLLGSVSHAALYHVASPVGVVRTNNETE